MAELHYGVDHASPHERVVPSPPGFRPSENSGERERAQAGPSGWVEPERALAGWSETRPAPRGGNLD